jgi:hypothetical protein
MDWVYRPAGTQPQPGYEAKTFAETCRLLDIGKSIMDVVYVTMVLFCCSEPQAISIGMPSMDLAADSQFWIRKSVRLSTSSAYVLSSNGLLRNHSSSLQLHDWNSKLSDDLKNTVKMRQNPTPHFLQLHLSFEWCFILLHRPFFRKRSSRSVIRDHPIDHAKVRDRTPTKTYLSLILQIVHTDLPTRSGCYHGTTQHLASTLHFPLCTHHFGAAHLLRRHRIPPLCTTSC